MLVGYEVTVKNLIDRLLICTFDHSIVLGQRVDDSELASLASQTSNDETIVLPPRHREVSLIPIRIWSNWREMQITASWCIILLEPTFGIDECFRL